MQRFQDQPREQNDVYEEVAKMTPADQLVRTKEMGFIALEKANYSNEDQVLMVIGNWARWWVMTTKGLIGFPNSTWQFEYMPGRVRPLFLTDWTVSGLTLPFVIVTSQENGLRALFLLDENSAQLVVDKEGTEYFETEWECEVLARTYLIQFQVWMGGAVHRNKNPTNALH